MLPADVTVGQDPPPGGVDPATVGNRQAQGGLPSTGIPASTMALFGASLLVLGGLLGWIRRRRPA